MITIEFDDKEYQTLLTFINEKYSCNFNEYSRSSMYRRISRFMINQNLKSIPELIRMISESAGNFETFVEEITVNVTEMFRDPLFFKSLKENVLPQLNTFPFFRIWDAGCSTGEETYSLSILLFEAGIMDKARIYATDINKQVLTAAKEGIYPLAYMKDYSRNYQNAGGKYSLSDYYHARYNNCIMKEMLRRNFLFSSHNLVHDGFFNEFQLIVCRNVLIYFNRELQEKVLNLFYESLPINGFLALGNKESIRFTPQEKNFEVVDAKEKIFKKIR